jgi:hypothetical protein
MVKQRFLIRLSDKNAGPADRLFGINVAATWLGYYLIAFLLIILTNPVTSKSDTWSGMALAYIVIMFGASRLASRGVTASTAFVYGCASSLLFLVRVLYLSRIELWGSDEPPSNAAVIAFGSVICASLGLSAVCIRLCMRGQWTDQCSETKAS